MEKTDLKVSYVHPPSFDRHKYINYIYHFDYLLEPASFWADFGSLTIKFNNPPNWDFASNLEVERLEGSNNDYEGHYQGLPENMLTISLISKEGFWFGHGTSFRLSVNIYDRAAKSRVRTLTGEGDKQ